MTTVIKIRVEQADADRFAALKALGLTPKTVFGRLLDIGEAQIRKSLPPRKPLKQTG